MVAMSLACLVGVARSFTAPARHFTTRSCPLASSAASSELPIIIPTKGVPIHVYTHDIDTNSLEQLTRLAESPIPVDYVSAMPDVHMGKGVTIGSVFASEKYVCPNAVGVDIGCGMAAVPIDGLYKGQLTADDMNQIQQLIKEQIPTGFSWHKSPLPGSKSVIQQITEEEEPTLFLKDKLKPSKVTNQLGTLGGGNHFLEILHEDNEAGRVWVMVHSGSRGIGNQVAQYHDGVAKNLLQKKGVDTESLRGLNYMPIESQEGQDYLRDMEWCQRYAFHNRRLMKETMLGIVEKVTGKPANMAEAVNIHHNYCACEECGNGKKLWVTRKGATSAKLGEMGIIPGSMGVGSYITRGKGNPMSWSSSAHGAGRRLSRTKATEIISQEEFEESMKGVVCDTDPSIKDEAPQAYKDLSEVMKNQESLTDIVHRLLPLINVKGFGLVRKRKKHLSKNGELESLNRQRESLLNDIEKTKEKLDSKTFMANAATKKVKATKAKLEKLTRRLAKIDADFENLSK